MPLTFISRVAILYTFSAMALAGSAFADVSLQGSLKIKWHVDNRRESFVKITDSKDPNFGRFQKVGCSSQISSDWSGTGVLQGYPKRRILNKGEKCLDTTFIKFETSKIYPNHLFLNHSSDVDNHNLGGVEVQGTIDYSADIEPDLQDRSTADIKKYVFSSDGTVQLKTSLKSSVESAMKNVVGPNVAATFPIASMQEAVIDDSKVFADLSPKIRLTDGGNRAEISYPNYEYDTEFPVILEVTAEMLNSTQAKVQ